MILTSAIVKDLKKYNQVTNYILEKFQKIVREFGDFCKLHSTSNEISIHQIKTTTSSTQIGKSASEGIHRDGVDVMGIFCVNRQNIEGVQAFSILCQKKILSLPKYLIEGNFCFSMLVNSFTLLHRFKPFVLKEE